MNANTYILYIKSSEPALKTLKIKAQAYLLTNEGAQVQFEDDKVVAIFNMAELVGFAESGHIAN
jgi:hypothetical protein